VVFVVVYLSVDNLFIININTLFVFRICSIVIAFISLFKFIIGICLASVIELNLLYNMFNFCSNSDDSCGINLVELYKFIFLSQDYLI